MEEEEEEGEDRLFGIQYIRSGVGLVWVGLGWAAEKIGPVPRLSALSFTCPPRCLLRTKKRTGEGENPFNFFSPSSAASCGNDPFRGRRETVPYDKRLFAPLFLYSGIP